MKQRHNKMMTAMTMVMCLACLLPASMSHAQDADGGTTSPFALGAGSRAIGLGRAFVSAADDASAVYWNPAALRNVQSRQIMAMYMPVFGEFTEADYTFIGAVYPTLGAGVFGAGFMRIGTTFDAYDEFSRSLGESNYSESQVLISYAAQRHNRWIGGTMALGSSFKIVSQNVDPFSSTSPGVDVGLRYIPDMARSLSLGVNLQDAVGADHRLNAASDKTYRTVLAGASWTRVFAGGSAMRLMAQVDLPERADNRVHFGAEYAFSRYISLRAGFDDEDISFGLGVNVSSYGFDYAYLTRDEPGASHPVTFTATFGASLPEQREVQARRRAEENRALIRQTFEARVAEHRDEAERLESAGDWAGALEQWQMVLGYMPEDPDATAAAEQAREQVLARQAAATRNAENQAIIRTRFEQGLTFFEDQNYQGARSEWQAILAIDSTHVGASEYLQRTQDKIDEAVADHIRRARSLEQQNRLTEAIAEWNNVQQYEPNHREAARAIQRLRDRIQSVSRDYEAAQRQLRIVTLYNDALTYFNNGEYERTVANLDQLLALQRDHEDAKRLRVLAQRKLTPLTEVEKARIRQLYLAGMQYFSKDEYARAITEWRKILEIDPSNESVQNNIREAEERLRQLEEKEGNDE
jgi:tetratricopeptide (TPR) repeat protein